MPEPSFLFVYSLLGTSQAKPLPATLRNSGPWAQTAIFSNMPSSCEANRAGLGRPQPSGSAEQAEHSFLAQHSPGLHVLPVFSVERAACPVSSLPRTDKVHKGSISLQTGAAIGVLSLEPGAQRAGDGGGAKGTLHGGCSGCSQSQGSCGAGATPIGYRLASESHGVTLKAWHAWHPQSTFPTPPPQHTPAPVLRSPVSTLHWGLPAAPAKASYLQSFQEVGEDVGGRAWDLGCTLTGTVTLA